MKNPAFFQGKRRKKKYFEGWYFKCISANRKHVIAIIPGIAMDSSGRSHSFIQIINAVNGKTWYHHFPYDEFKSPSDSFEVCISKNKFNSDGLSLNIDTPEGCVSGALSFKDIHRFPVAWNNPGIMGPLTYLPFMECYHAIVHLQHKIDGIIELDGEKLDFTDGIGYLEKDYGRSFPKTYIWLQASHFDSGDGSFVFSRALIPFLGKEFTGFFAYFTNFDDVNARFATYNFSKLTKWQADTDKRTCSGLLSGPSGTLEFSAKMSGGGVLRAPVDGVMDRHIVESITATVTIKLTNRHNRVIFQGTSDQVGMEICQ
jgi:hypothetical protein